MYEKNGIVYPDDLTPLPGVCGVRPLNDYKLWLRFKTGEEKIFDCEPLLKLPAFLPLRDPDVFRSVYIDYGTAVWNDGELDIAPETLYDRSVPAS